MYKRRNRGDWKLIEIPPPPPTHTPVAEEDKEIIRGQIEDPDPGLKELGVKEGFEGAQCDRICQEATTRCSMDVEYRG